MSLAPAERRCGDCRHFIDDPRELEQRLVGLTILSSAWGDTRGDQGLCDVHELFLQPVMICSRFEVRRAEQPAQVRRSA